MWHTTRLRMECAWVKSHPSLPPFLQVQPKCHLLCGGFVCFHPKSEFSTPYPLTHINVFKGTSHIRSGAGLSPGLFPSTCSMIPSSYSWSIKISSRKKHLPVCNFEHTLFFTSRPSYWVCGFCHLFSRILAKQHWFLCAIVCVESEASLVCVRPFVTCHLHSEVMGKGHILWGNTRADGTRNWKKCKAGNGLDLWPWPTDWLDARCL